MMKGHHMELSRKAGLRGEIAIPGDKSISHRAVMFNALAHGEARITGFLNSADCVSTIRAFTAMGAQVRQDGTECVVRGAGLHGLRQPDGSIDCGNSGTTTRLISGILAGQTFGTRLTGDASLSKRPMRRIMEPLSMMGAEIVSEQGNDCLPLSIRGGALRGIRYESPVASAQVKSAVLLAGLYADGPTTVIEPERSRDHTERMLRAFGARISVDGLSVTTEPCERLEAQDIAVPGDVSSAAFFLAAGAVCPGSEILLKNVGLNPTRDGAVRMLQAMGADLTVLDRKDIGGEPSADLLIRHSALKGCTIEGSIIPTLIDELPVLAVCAAYADGETVIRGAKELRVKESDRISAVCEGLSAMGADVEELEDGMIIRGGRALHGAEIRCFDDHRIAMSFAVASLAAEGTTVLQGAECVNISYPAFFRDLSALG